MKIFIDTANVAEIKKANEWGIIDGVTTNPSLIAKEEKKFEQIFREIVDTVNGPISVEVNREDAEGMVEEALFLARWASNIVIKIPMTKEGLRAVKILNEKNIKTNVTLVFSANQALLAAKAGASYVSIFIGRLDDLGHEGMQVVRDTIEALSSYDFETQVIVASIRHPLHVIDAAKAGAQVATVPYNILEKMFLHPLTDIGLKMFREDRKRVRKMNRAVIIDRDGVITQDPPHYAHRIDQLKIIPDSAEAIRILNEKGFLVVVVTNQSGVAKGMYQEEDVERFNTAMEEELKKKGAFVDALYYCPHHPEATVEKYKVDCYCRKPNPGMLERAAKDMNIDLTRSFMIGDKLSDIQAGQRVCCKTILVLTGHGREELRRLRESDRIKPTFVVNDLYHVIGEVSLRK